MREEDEDETEKKRSNVREMKANLRGRLLNPIRNGVDQCCRGMDYSVYDIRGEGAGG